jgi:hypothetical protein
MARAGYCHDCGAYVWLGDDWRCPQGHARERANAWYDSDTGQALAPPWVAAAAQAVGSESLTPEPVAGPAPTPVAAGAASRVDLLHAILAAFAAYPGYQVRYGTDTDVLIDNKVADGSYGTGKKKVEFEAIMKAVEPDLTVFYWEILKEKGAGISMGGFESESYSTFGAKRSGTKKELLMGPGGVVAYEWDYGKTRQIVEATAAQHGWKVKTVLKKSSAKW